MTTGDHFCTFGILFDINSDASVVAKTYCEVLKLMKEDLDEVLANHPSLIKYVVVSNCNTPCPEKRCHFNFACNSTYEMLTDLMARTFGSDTKWLPETAGEQRFCIPRNADRCNSQTDSVCPCNLYLATQ